MKVAGQCPHASVHFRQPTGDRRIIFGDCLQVIHDLFDSIASVADEDAVVPCMDRRHHPFRQIAPIAERAHFEIVGEYDRRPRQVCRALDHDP